MISVLICDDQDIVRKGLHIILSHSEGITVVGEAADGREAVRLAQQTKPDVICMDLKMPHLNGIQATKQIRELLPETKVLVLTTYDADEWVFDAVRAGANGYLLKDTDGAEIVAAVRETAEGKTRIDPNIAGKVLDAFRQLEKNPPKRQPEDPLLEKLTEREMSILRLMAQGHTNRQIAEALYLAPGTIKNNVSHIIHKLQTNDRTQAVLAALRRGLVDL